MTTLNSTNAHTASTIRNINNPEWGVKKFTYNGQPIGNNEFVHIVGVGQNSSILTEQEMKFWEIVTTK